MQKTALSLILVLCFTTSIYFVKAQSYTSPKYKEGPKAFTSYLGNYCRMFDLLPHERDFSDTYVYTTLIARDGSVKFANVLGKDLDIRTELKRVIKLSDKWQPAKMNNQLIDTIFSDTIWVCSSVGSGKVCWDFDSTRTLQYYSVPASSIITSGTIDMNKGTDAYNEGRGYYATEKYTNAIASFERAINEHYQPKKEPVFNIGVCYMQLNKNENACYYFLEAARYGDAESENVYKQKCKGVEPFAPIKAVDSLPGVFTFVEVMPEFSGGANELLKFISKNIKYPSEELKKEIAGRVMLRFVITEEGSISDVAVLRGITPAIDAEAVRIVRSLPKFSPGMEAGKPVKVYYNLPIVFKLG